MPSEGVFLVDGDDLVEMQHSAYVDEADLQSLLEHHPDLMPGRQINPGSPREWLLIAREQGVPDALGAADLWSADHLFVDQDGVPTIVEVKRSSDTRIRREVVGQMLDYAANGVRNWPVERLRADLAARLGGPDRADEAVRAFLDRADRPDTTVEALWAGVEANLQAGRLRLLFVADVIPPTLRRIIEFLNEQMTQCEVLGIEIRQYVAAGRRVLAPTVVGQSGQSARTKRQPDSRTFAELMASASDEVRELESRLNSLAEEQGWLVTTSSAGRQYRLQDRWTLIQLFPGDGAGALQFALGAISDAGLAGEAADLQGRLSTLLGSPMSARQPWTRVGPVLAGWAEFAGEWLPAYAEAARAAARLKGGLTDAPRAELGDD